jgi:hypothetical protein
MMAVKDRKIMCSLELGELGRIGVIRSLDTGIPLA